MIAASKMMVIQLALERYCDVIVISDLGLYSNEQVHLLRRIAFILAVENYNVTILPVRLTITTNLLLQNVLQVFFGFFFLLTITRFEMKPPQGLLKIHKQLKKIFSKFQQPQQQLDENIGKLACVHSKYKTLAASYLNITLKLRKKKSSDK